MPTITLPSANVTVEEVSAVLREKLGPRYTITPATTSRFHRESPAGADWILARRHWFEQASIRVTPGPDSTEVHVGSAANFTPTGFLINRAGIVRKVHQALRRAPELAGPPARTISGEFGVT